MFAYHDPPSLWRPGCTFAPDCSQSLYKQHAREAPFAVVGHFNEDEHLDVVVDGNNRTHGRRLALLTSPAGVVVTEIEKIPRISPRVEDSRPTNGRWRAWDEGVSEALSFTRAGSYASSHEQELLTLAAGRRS